MPTDSTVVLPSSLQIPSLFNDHMVVQRDKPIPIWGWDLPGQKISVCWNSGEAVTTLTTDAGDWRVILPALNTAGPHQLSIQGSSERVIQDVLAGEVWICSGQSNMQFGVQQTLNGAEEVAGADFQEIRLFTVARKTAFSPARDVEGEWTVCSPETIKEFSAVGYFFGRKIHQELNVPVGLINASWGASSIEAWTALEDFAAEPTLTEVVQRTRENLEIFEKGEVETDQLIKKWEAHRDQALADTRGVDSGWANSDFNDSDWESCLVPGYFDEVTGDLDGAVWYRRTLDIPASWAGQDLELHLGVIDDLDHTYWNGQLVGRTGIETSAYYSHPRIYTIPGRLVTGGFCTLAVRVFDEYLSGGFISAESELWVAPVSAPEVERLSLAGLWKIKVELSIPEKPMAPGAFQTRAEGAFNAMLAPLIPYAIRGALWYQAEQNSGYEARYRIQFPMMIQAWRRRWQQGEFPFLFVQLPNFGARRSEVFSGNWPVMRDAQTSALALPGTGMAITLDVGEANDIHPINKQPVGQRLALIALAKVYDRNDVESSGPVLTRWEINGAEVRIDFDHVGTGLITTDGEPVRGFLRVGEDGEVERLVGRIENQSVVISLNDSSKPVEIRYAWEDNPDVNLTGSHGLPTAPFRINLIS